MVIISKRPINNYLERFPHHQDEVMRWYYTVLESDWRNFADIKNSFNSVDGVGNGLFIFNVKGNQCRIVVRIIFKVRTVFIKFIGMHKEYDKLDISIL